MFAEPWLILSLASFVSACGSSQLEPDASASHTPTASTSAVTASGSATAPQPPQAPTNRAAADAPVSPDDWLAGEGCQVPDLLARNPNLSTYRELAEKVQLSASFATNKGVTMLIPIDGAFAAMDPAKLQALRNDLPRLRNLMAAHFLMGTLRHDYLAKEEHVTTLSQQRGKLQISRDGEALQIGDARVLRGDIECAGVIIHLVDLVTIPSTFDPARRAGPFGVNLWVLPDG